jgi:hypothetical protein
MIDHVLEQRIQKNILQPTSSREGIIKKSEANMLSLRKNKIEEYIMNKRKLRYNISAPELEINLGKLYIPQELLLDIDRLLENVCLFLIYSHF